jgi:hypothetical protein
MEYSTNTTLLLLVGFGFLVKAIIGQFILFLDY